MCQNVSPGWVKNGKKGFFSYQLPFTNPVLPKYFLRCSFLSADLRVKSINTLMHQGVDQPLLKKTWNFMAPFCGWGSTTSRREPLHGGSLLFTTKFPEIPGTHRPQKDEWLSWPTSHPVVLNMRPLDWESSALTTRPLHLNLKFSHSNSYADTIPCLFFLMWWS